MRPSNRDSVRRCVHNSSAVCGGGPIARSFFNALDLAQATGLALADFDVLAQQARAGGELRMTDLAARALVSRSGMTRRIARLVEEGLVRRANADADGRGVVVALTDAGLARLTETAPVHLRGVSELFVAKLDEQELAVLKNALDKVTVDCAFG
jgi:DNA-binding MarR family transcriptional regulator